MEKTIFIGILYLIFFSLAAVWGLSYDNWQLRQHLVWVSPLSLEIHFFLILLGGVINLSLFKDIFKAIRGRTRLLLLLTVLSGTLITMFVAPRTHRIYYDEDIYLNIGQNIAMVKKAAMCNEGEHIYGEYFCYRLEYNKQPNGWPYLTSIIFRLFGVSHLLCHLLNNLIWGLSIVSVFLVGFLLFDDQRAGMLGALMFALIPEGLIWSNTTSAEPSAALFTSLAVLSMLLFAKHPERKTLFLASVLLSFSLQFRPESLLVSLPLGLILLFLARREFLNAEIYLFILLFLILALPHFIHLYAVKSEGWGAAGGSKFALSYLKENLSVNGLFYLKNRRFPLICTLFFFAGLFLPALKSGKEGKIAHKTGLSFLSKEKSIVLSWFLAFWGIFIFFYAGSYNYGADVRFSLLSYIPFAVLAGFGASASSRWLERFGFERSSPGLAMLILVSFLWFMPYVRALKQEAWGARMDHDYAEIMVEKLPPGSLILTHNPNMFLLWGKNAAQSSLATHEQGHIRNLYNRFPGGIYFHYNFWCNVSDPTQRAFCSNILKKYKTTKVISFQERDYTYAFYRLEFK